MVEFAAPPNQNLPFVDLPNRATPVHATWYQAVHDTLLDLAGAGGRVPALEAAEHGGDDGLSSQLMVSGRTAALGGLSGHRVVVPVSAAGVVGYADSGTSAHTRSPLWMTLGAGAAGAPVDVLARGLVTEPSWSWTPGSLYLGAGGLLTQAAPVSPGAKFVAVVAWAVSATSVFFDPQPSITLA